LGLIDYIRERLFSQSNEEQQSEEVVVMANPELLEPTSVPKNLVRYLWGIIEKDLPLSYLTEQDQKLVQLKINRIAELIYLMEPEVPHPEIYRIVRQSIKAWVDEENTKLFGWVRSKRALYGMERRMTYVPPRFAG